MAGDDDEIEAVIPTEFADCVCHEDLEATCKRMEEKTDETVHKSVHDAIITMDLGTILDRLYKRMTELVDRVNDEDITPMDTNNTPQVDIQGPITRARARQLNLQVVSFLRNYSCAFESSMLPNDLIILRNQGEDHGGQTEHQEGAGEPRRRAREGGEPI
jgi:hypothetical protein